MDCIRSIGFLMDVVWLNDILLYALLVTLLHICLHDVHAAPFSADDEMVRLSKL